MAIGRPVSLTSNIASKVVSVVSTAGQTVFTVSGGYTINQLSVFRNGIRLSQGKDYTASNGSTVTLLSGANNGDNIEFEVFDSFQVADAITSSGTNQVLSSNLDVQGNLTAVTHIGNVTGTAATFTTITVNDQISGNITGTAATFTTGTFSGPVSVGGTLTYEDATNVDSVGLVTARTGVRVTAGGLVVTAGVSTFAGAIDLNAELDVDGQTDLDTLQVAGVSTFSAALDVNAELDVDGQTDLDTLQVAGVSTFAAAVDINHSLTVDNISLDANTVTTNSGNLTLNSTGGKVDIIDAVDISGTTTIAADVSIADKIIHTGDTNTAIRFPAADTFTVETGGSERLRVNSSGNVGIGTDNPSTGLHLLSADSYVTLQSSSASGNAGILFKDSGGTQNSVIFYDFDDDYLKFSVASDTEALRINSAGKVLVGTSTASSYADRLLTVGNTSHSSPTIEIRSSTTGFAGLVFSDSTAANSSSYRGTLEYDHSNDLMQIRTAGNIVSVIDSDGNLGIGTDNPQDKLHVNGTSDFIVDTDAAGLRFGSYGEHDIALVTGRNTSSGSSRFYIENGDGESLRITSAGNVGIGTISPQAKLVVSNGSAGLEFNTNSNQAIVSYNRVTSTYTPIGLQGSYQSFSIGGVGEVLRIDSSGRLLHGGHTTPFITNSNFEVKDTGNGLPIMTMIRNESIAADSEIGRIRFSTGDGYETAAIRSHRPSDGGTWNSTSTPAFLHLMATPDGATQASTYASVSEEFGLTGHTVERYFPVEKEYYDNSTSSWVATSSFFVSRNAASINETGDKIIFTIPTCWNHRKVIEANLVYGATGNASGTPWTVNGTMYRASSGQGYTTDSVTWSNDLISTVLNGKIYMTNMSNFPALQDDHINSIELSFTENVGGTTLGVFGLQLIEVTNGKSS